MNFRTCFTLPAIAIFTCLISTPLLGQIGDVSLSKTTFNPSRDQSITVTFRCDPSAAITALVIDRDGYAVKRIETIQSQDTIHSFTWNGRDERGRVVPDEAYSFKIDAKSKDGREWSYFPAQNPSEHLELRVDYYDRARGVLAYTLPVACRVHLQAGIARSKDDGTYEGPVLKTIVNRAPRPQGSVIESWNGYDESEVIYIPDEPNFVTAVAATPLPENGVIAFGSKGPSLVETASSRSGATLLAIHEGTHHSGLSVLEDLSPELEIEVLNGRREGRDWILDGDTAQLQIRLVGPSADSVGRQPGRVVIFVDYEEKGEIEAADHPLREKIRIKELGSEGKLISVNWQSRLGPLAANTIRIRPVPKTAEQGRRQ